MTTEATIERRKEDPPIVAALKQWEPDLIAALPDGYTASRFKSVCINLARANPQLLNVTPLSFVASVLMSAQMGLEPGAPLGLSWIIPRRIKGTLEANFQVGYQGLRQLAYRSGVVSHIEARIVHDGDEFTYEHGLGGTNWKHIPEGTPDRDWTDVYCAARLATGAEPFESMTKAEVLAHRDRYVKDWSKSKAWKENEPEMARKTVTARLCRQLPMSVEFRTALAVDGYTPRELAPDLAGLVALERSAEEPYDENDPERPFE
jgi:recombination protein RecT